ncbi:MAG: hypothetical protein RR993_03145 [Clostridia bacterium]
MIDGNVEMLLNQLENEIRNGKKQIFGNARTIDDALCLQIIAKIHQELPSTIAEARVVSQERENLLADASEQANMIVAQAQSQADRLLNENDIILQAQDEAIKIVNDANNYAAQLVNDKCRQALDIIVNAEYAVRNSADILAGARQELQKNN